MLFSSSHASLLLLLFAGVLQPFIAGSKPPMMSPVVSERVRELSKPVMEAAGKYTLARGVLSVKERSKSQSATQLQKAEEDFLHAEGILDAWKKVLRGRKPSSSVDYLDLAGLGEANKAQLHMFALAQEKFRDTQEQFQDAQKQSQYAQKQFQSAQDQAQAAKAQYDRERGNAERALESLSKVDQASLSERLAAAALIVNPNLTYRPGGGSRFESYGYGSDSRTLSDEERMSLRRQLAVAATPRFSRPVGGGSKFESY